MHPRSVLHTFCPQECYNLAADPLETRNLGHVNATLTAPERVQLVRLRIWLV